MNSPLLLPQGRPDRVEFRPRPEVSRGGCILHTRFGVIDARRETKIESLRDALLS
jgi:flagellar biosynthesis/type III secretory pathway protein FliH